MSLNAPRTCQQDNTPVTKTITAETPSLIDFLNPVGMCVGLYRARGLIGQFTRREVVGAYRGTYLGFVWQLITPLLMLGVFTLAFGVIMDARFSSDPSASKLSYAFNLFCGLIVFGVFSSTISRSPNLVMGHRNYVKKVIFPLEILPVAVLGSSLVNAAMSLAVLMIALLVFMSGLPLTALLFPLVLLPLCCLALGISWFLASLGVFLRDVGQAVSVLLQLLFFLSPVIYPVSAVPQKVRFLFQLNPLTFILEDARRILMAGEWPHWTQWLIVTAGSLVVLQLGYAWFMRSKRAFADIV